MMVIVSYSLIIWVRMVLKRTVVGCVQWCGVKVSVDLASIRSLAVRAFNLVNSLSLPVLNVGQ